MAYRWGWKTVTRLPVPVIVVGNITVGGTGKTPVVLHLAQALQEAGYRPGILSRGYGRRTKRIDVQPVQFDSDPARVGDEPLLLAQRCTCPVWVGRDRAAAGAALLVLHPEVDVLLCDDGLQHYRLARDIELVVVDAGRGVGNGHLLPWGPLREGVWRLATVDGVILNQAGAGEPPPQRFPQLFPMRRALKAPCFGLQLRPRQVRNLVPQIPAVPWASFVAQQAQTKFAALAGIGHPQRFFAQLHAAGLQISEHPFPDHYAYQAADLPTGPVLMTAKDAVKCADLAPQRQDLWVIDVDAEVDAGLKEHILRRLAVLQLSPTPSLNEESHGPQTA